MRRVLIAVSLTLATTAMAQQMPQFPDVPKNKRPPNRTPGPRPTVQKPIVSVDATAELSKLVDNYFERLLVLDPLFASSVGDYRYNGSFTVGISEPWRTAKKALNLRFIADVNRIDPKKLSPQDQITREIFLRALREENEGFKYPDHLLPINQLFSMPQQFAEIGSGNGIHPFRSSRDYYDFLRRTKGFAQWVDVAIENMRRGIFIDIVQPRIVIERAIPQIEAHIVAKPEESIFWTPLRSFPDNVTKSERETIEETYRAAITNLLVPSYKRLAEFLKNDYLPKTRDTIAHTALFNYGPAWYAYLVKQSTTTDMTPDQIHEIGLAEMARIRAEMEKLKESTGFKGTLLEFAKNLQDDPRLKFKSKEDVVQTYREVKVRVDKLTPKLFSRIPKADYEVRAVEPFREESFPGGAYNAASPDGSRPGVFLVNTFNWDKRSKFGSESLSLHEGAPGHHFQIALQQEMTDLPRFRRFMNYTAYAEGWGLYAESLGKELGVFQDPAMYFGRLNAEYFRAMRLVLDTGIHTKGWTREQTIEKAKEMQVTATPPPIAEIDRYIANPAQALGYKIGQLEIQRLRTLSEKELGQKFDIKEFHAQVLEEGALPLDILAAKINRWIETKKGATATPQNAQPVSTKPAS